MKRRSTRSLLSAANWGYALGLFAAFELSSTKSISDGFWNGIMLLSVPIALTVVLFFVQYTIVKREGAAVRVGRGSGAIPSHEWAVILLIYMVFALGTVALRGVTFSG